MDFESQFFENYAIAATRTVPASRLGKVLLTGLCKTKQVPQFGIGETLTGRRGRGLSMLLDRVYIHHDDCAEAHVMGEPERLDQDSLFPEAIHQRHDFLRGIDAFLDMIRDHWMRNLRVAARIRKVIQQE